MQSIAIPAPSQLAISFQDLLLHLKQYWADQGCIIVEPYDLPMGAGTFHPDTFIRSLGKKDWASAYCQPSRRPTDGRYGDNPNRLGRYYQFQVLMKPAPDNIQELYIQSLASLGLSSKKNDIRFVEDNWESPALGAWGLGWEVWLNGMEVTQFTYFQQVGGIACDPISVEITYGCERLAMYLQKVDSVYDLVWHANSKRTITYGDRYQQYEMEQSAYCFEKSSVPDLKLQFDSSINQGKMLCSEDQSLPLAAYDQLLYASHTFNLLDARGAYTVAERKAKLLSVRQLSHIVAQSILASEES